MLGNIYSDQGNYLEDNPFLYEGLKYKTYEGFDGTSWSSNLHIQTWVNL